MKKVIIVFLASFLIACNSNSDIDNNSDYKPSQNTSVSTPKEPEKEESEKSNTHIIATDASSENDTENTETEKYPDDTYTATVNYYNPETSYSATYTLDVKVENNEVVEIDFPKGGWLDSSHITPDELDEEGHVSIDGEDGKTYDIQIESL